MKHSARSSLVSQAISLLAPQSCLHHASRHAVPPRTQNTHSLFHHTPTSREARKYLSTSARGLLKPAISPTDLDQNVTKEEQEHYDEQIAADKKKQIRTPWHREGSDRAPVATNRSAGAMTKGSYSETALCPRAWAESFTYMYTRTNTAVQANF